MPQFDLSRVQELRAILADINSADQSRLSELYKIHIGYCPFDDDPSAIVESVKDDLDDFIREVAYSEGIHYGDIGGVENR